MEELKQILRDMGSAIRDVWETLRVNPAFWVALIAFANAVQQWLWPQVPDDVMAKANVLAGIVALAIAGRAVVRAWRAREWARLQGLA